MHYYAFVTRDTEQRYCAQLPDFPGCAPRAESLADLPQAVATAVRAQADERRLWTLPLATPLHALPRTVDALDGFWILVDLASCMEIRRRRAPA